MTALAEIAGGTYDGVDWRITNGGGLIIGNGGTQTFTNRSPRSISSYPWYSYRNQITSARFDGTVVGNGSVGSMFYNCSSLTSLELSGFDTGNVRNMSYMFYNCSSLTSLDLFSFDTGSVTNMIDMFTNCNILNQINLSGQFSFKGSGNTSCNLPTPPSSTTTGKWNREDETFGRAVYIPAYRDDRWEQCDRGSV